MPFALDDINFYAKDLAENLMIKFAVKELGGIKMIIARFTICCLFLVFVLFTNSAFSQGKQKVDFRSSAFVNKVEEYMQARVSVSGFSGTVLVAHDGKPIFQKGYGLANRDFDIPNTTNTKFRIGSITKPFTAAAILLLEQRGKLKITDPVSQYLPEWSKAWSEVTIHHLLTHSAGLPRLTTQVTTDVSGLTRPNTAPPFRSVQDLYKPGEELQPLDFKPGERMVYSNVGYIVLGLIIEKVSGKSYADFMHDEIFRPLGMNDTACEGYNSILKQRATGYTPTGKTFAEASYVDMRAPAAAGCLYSTVDDLLIWDSALYSERLLTINQREKLFTPPRAFDPNNWNYANGWWVSNHFNRRVQWHRGNVAGFFGIIARYPEERLFVTVLSNTQGTQVRAVANELAAIAFGEKYELPRERKKIEINPATYDAYVGKYERLNQVVNITRDGNRLLIQIPGPPPFEIFPESAMSFFSGSGEIVVTFSKDDNGKTAHFIMRNEGEESKWIKSQ